MDDARLRCFNTRCLPVFSSLLVRIKAELPLIFKAADFLCGCRLEQVCKSFRGIMFFFFFFFGYKRENKAIILESQFKPRSFFKPSKVLSYNIIFFNRKSMPLPEQR